MIDIIKECGDAKSIAITGHTNPDGDCIGSVTALYQFLKKAVPGADVRMYIEQPDPSYNLINAVEQISSDYSEDIVYDVVFVLDSVTTRCGDAEKYIQSAKKVKQFVCYRIKRYTINADTTPMIPAMVM